MTQSPPPSIEVLFARWREGDAYAGEAMAQRFTDWFYAIAVSRFGEVDGDAFFRGAAQRFTKGVVKVDDPRRLLAWSHQLLRKQLAGLPGPPRATDGDLANAFTRQRSPKQLLALARPELPEAMVVLERTYRALPSHLPATLSPDVDPRDTLHARLAVKRWLATHHGVPFKVLPEDADLDDTPLPRYEAGRLANESEEAMFELYMLSKPEVCQDVAEFAHYALALRGGVPASPARPVQRPATPDRNAAARRRPADEAPLQRAPKAPPPPPSTRPVTVVLLGLIVVLVGLIALVLNQRGGDPG
jgi:hypothetical protein